MVFGEIFMFLVFVLAGLYIVRVAVKKYRQAGVKGKMVQIEETEQTAQAIRQFKKEHPDPKRDQDEVRKF